MNGVLTAETHLWEITTLLDLVPRKPIHDVASAILLAHQFGRTIHILDDSMIMMERFFLVASRTYLKNLLRTLAWTVWKHDQLGNVVPRSSSTKVLAPPLAEHLGHGDILIALCTNGDRPSVFAIVRAASLSGTITVGITTTLDSSLMALTDHCITIPSDDREYVTDIFFVVFHALCRELDQRIGAAHDGDTSGRAGEPPQYHARQPAAEGKRDHRARPPIERERGSDES